MYLYFGTQIRMHATFIDTNWSSGWNTFRSIKGTKFGAFFKMTNELDELFFLAFSFALDGCFSVSF